MPSSQLKRLKASLKEQGIIGPQKSKKEKKRNGRQATSGLERISRSAALENIREQFNPFEFTHSRGPKFPTLTNRPESKGIKGRPGVSKAVAEERRRQTLLPELQGRNKAGIIVDRRFGEDDASLTVEERARERFVRAKRGALFDLEEDPSFELTHGGKSLKFDAEGPVDDFNEVDLGSDGESSGDERKRRTNGDLDDGGVSREDEEQQDRRKTKKEVMEEIIAKSKLHKQERQIAKEANEKLADEVNVEYSELLGLLAESKSKALQGLEKARAGLGVEKDAISKEIDVELRKLALDRRVQVSTRTKTDAEIAEEQQDKLKELEEKRQRRMRGEQESSSDEEDDAADEPADSEDPMRAMFADEEENFGLGKGIKTRPTATELGLDDEDDFLIEDDLIASGSDMDSEDSDEESDADDAASGDDSNMDPGAFRLSGKEPALEDSTMIEPSQRAGHDGAGLPSSLPCPQSVQEFVQMASSYQCHKLPAIIQRIRVQYDAGLDAKNKEQLGNFSKTLVDFIASPLHSPNGVSFATLESVIRHLHSLCKTYPMEVAQQCRVHLGEVSQKRPTSLHTGDLVLLTAIGTIFPTSDHFHQVVTPAMLCIGRYLGQKVPQTLADFATGTYIAVAALQYQQFAKRYVPECLNFSLNALCALAAIPSTTRLGNFPIHAAPQSIRVEEAQKVDIRKLSFGDCMEGDLSEAASASCKVALIATNVALLEAASDTWSGLPSYLETFEPVSRVLQHLASGANRAALPAALAERVDRAAARTARALRVAALSRRTLELHHHRPLAIKSYDPKWEDGFDPRKHYDPDRDRAEQAKLQAEIKRERKGALRELRKDSRFLAREKLKTQKARDEAYESKMRRTIAEIQNEGGRETNEYEREVKARKRAKHRH